MLLSLNMMFFHVGSVLLWLNYIPLYKLTVSSSLVIGNPTFLVANPAGFALKTYPKYDDLYLLLVVKSLNFSYFL